MRSCPQDPADLSPETGKQVSRQVERDGDADRSRNSLLLPIASIVLVIAPLVFLLWAGFALADQEGEDHRASVRKELAELARELLTETDPGHLTRAGFLAWVGKEGHTRPQPDERNSPVAWWRSGDGAASCPGYLEDLGRFFQTGSMASPSTFFRLTDNLGWGFRPAFCRDNPGLPVEVLWNGSWHRLIWDFEPGTDHVRLAVLPPPDQEKAIREACGRRCPGTSTGWSVLQRTPENPFRTASAALPPQSASLPYGIDDRGPEEKETHVERINPWLSLILERPVTDPAPGIRLRIAAMAAILFLFLGLGMRNFPRWSVRAKTGFFVVYLVGVPLMIILVQSGALRRGRVFREESRLRQEGEAMLLDFDRRYSDFEMTFGKGLKSLVGSDSFRRSNPESLRSIIQPLIEGGRIQDILVLDQKGFPFLSLSKTPFHGERSRVHQEYIQSILEERNSLPRTSRSKMTDSLFEVFRKSSWGSVVESPGRLVQFMTEGKQVYSFIYFFPQGKTDPGAKGRPTPESPDPRGKAEEAPRPGAVLIQMGMAEVARTYLKQNLPGNWKFRISARERETGNWFPDPTTEFPAFEAFVDSVARQKRLLNWSFPTPDGTALVLGRPGQRLAGYDLIAFISPEKLAAGPEEWTRSLLLQAGLCMILLMAGWWFLSTSVIGPLRETLEGVQNLRRRRLDYRIQTTSGDELGRLGEAFNQMLEVSKEIQAAREVEERLQPPGDPKIPGISFRTWYWGGLALDGCIRDWFELPDCSWAILLGTSHGRGITAALGSGMARAIIISHCQEGLDPAGLFPRIHKAFLSLQGPAQASDSGSRPAAPPVSLCLLIYHPAGHSFVAHQAGFPRLALCRAQNGQISFPPNPGIPLGSIERFETGVFRETLSEGDSIVLASVPPVSDSSVESTEMIRESFHGLVRKAGNPLEGDFPDHFGSGLEGELGEVLKRGVSAVVIRRNRSSTPDLSGPSEGGARN